MNQWMDHYQQNRVYSMALVTKKTFLKVVELLKNRLDMADGEIEVDEANYTVKFRTAMDAYMKRDFVTVKLGDYFSTRNERAEVFTKAQVKYDFTRKTLTPPSYYTPTDAQVKVIQVLSENDEWCYPYNHICSETGLTRAEAKQAIDVLRQFGIVEFHRGLITEDGEVAGSGFGMGDLMRAEAMLWRYSEMKRRESEHNDWRKKMEVNKS